MEEVCAELLEVDELIDIPIYNERKTVKHGLYSGQ